MQRWNGKTSRLAALRRDGVLFALVGALLLLANALQPLAEARATSTGKAWVICTVYGAAKPPTPDGTPLPAAAADDCPNCLAGAPASSKAPPPADVAGPVPAYPALADAALVRWPEPNASQLPPGPAQPPSGIRAPPILA